MRHTLTILILFVFISGAAGHEKTGITKVKMLNAAEWVAVGYNGLFLKTTNAGTNWESRTIADGVYNLWDVAFFNSNTGIVAGVSDGYETYVGRTTDGGHTWSKLSFASSMWVTPMSFANDRVGFLYGFGSGMSSSIYKTTNGGLDWFRTNSYLMPYSVKSIFPVDSNNVYAGLSGGYIIYTSNGGNNWIFFDTGRPDDITDVYFINQNTGVYCSSYESDKDKKNGDDDNGWYLNFGKTTNRGQSWNVRWIRESDNYAMKYSGNSFYIIGDYNRILKTSDFGQNWDYNYYDVPVTASPYSMDIIGNTILVGGYGNNKSLLIKSTNGGVNWTSMSIPRPYFNISGIVKYSDNGQLITDGIVKAFKYDRSTGNIIVFDSTEIQWNGSYILTHIPQDTVYIGVYPNSQPVRDWIITYYPSTPYWTQTLKLYPTGNLPNINIFARRIHLTISSNSVNGKVMKTNPVQTGLKDAVVNILNGNNYVGCAITDNSGVFHVTSLPSGNLKVVVDRVGYKGDSVMVSMTPSSNIDSVNFILNRYVIGIRQLEGLVPLNSNLYQNYPNPFNPVTKIKFDITSTSVLQGSGNINTILKIYSITGKEIGTLLNKNLSPGTYEVDFDGSALSSGVYFYKLVYGNFVSTKKMLLVK